MSEDLKKKMHDFEVNPPAMVWDKLAAELNEIPAALGQKINAIQVAPPAGMWDKITSSIDEEATLQFPSKLAAMEVAPPTTAWKNISTTLHENDQQSSPGRVIPFFRYAVAASVVLALAFGAYRLFFNHSAVPESVVLNEEQKNETPVIKNDTAPSQSNDQVDTTKTIIPSNNLPKEDLAVTTGQHHQNTKIVQRQQAAAYMNQLVNTSKVATVSNFNFENVNLKGNIPANNFYVNNSNENRYLIFVNPDGKLVKISKKLAEQLGCIYGSGNDQQCLDKVKQWKDKIAQAPVSASTDNFMDIINMLKSLQENEL